MGTPYEPSADHRRDWLKFGGLGCAFYVGIALAILVVLAIVVLLIRWIL